jgi:hypothetical protein
MRRVSPYLVSVRRSERRAAQDVFSGISRPFRVGPEDSEVYPSARASSPPPLSARIKTARLPQPPPHLEEAAVQKCMAAFSRKLTESRSPK